MYSAIGPPAYSGVFNQSIIVPNSPNILCHLLPSPTFAFAGSSSLTLTPYCLMQQPKALFFVSRIGFPFSSPAAVLLPLETRSSSCLLHATSSLYYGLGSHFLLGARSCIPWCHSVGSKRSSHHFDLPAGASRVEF